MSKIPTRPLDIKEYTLFPDNLVESAHLIDQPQLNNAKIFSSREEYVKTFTPGIRYMEVGVAWGYYAKIVCETTSPSLVHLFDNYDQDLKCWSWRKFGSCQCDGMKHELLYTPETHQSYIDSKFFIYNNFLSIRGKAPQDIPKNFQYDYIYIDITNDRFETRDTLAACSKLIPIGGIIGLNDYTIYDGIIDDGLYGTYQTVNEFLMHNKNWEVDAIALHQLAFNDIYIKRIF